MRIVSLKSLLAVALVFGALPPLIAKAEDVGNGFNYQGRIKQNSALITGRADFRFNLWNAETGGQQIGSVIVLAPPNPSVNNVVNGLFDEVIDFGLDAFDGSARWLELEVRYPSNPGSGSFGFDPVSPRQPLNAAPYAMHALTGGEWTYSEGDIFFTGGNVGIGTTAPVGTLDVRGGVALMGDGLPVILEAQQGAPNESGGNIIFNAGANGTGNPFNGNLLFGISGEIANGEFTNGEVMRIDRLGRIGIGTTAPMSALHVHGPSAVTGIGTLRITSTDQPNNLVLDSDDIDTTLVPLYLNGNTTQNLILVQGGGKVGIGQLVPSCKLDVAGQVCSNGTPLTSDRRLKTNIQTLEHALDRVGALRGVTFDWRFAAFPERNLSHDPDIGFIAQEAMESVPEAVMLRNDGYYTLDYARLTPVLVEAVKELHGIVQLKNAELAAERQVNQHQQYEIASLNARLADLEELIETKLSGLEGDRP